MQGEEEPSQVVLEGREPDGTTWAVDVRPDPTCDDGLYTFVRRTAVDGGRRGREWEGRSCTAMAS